MAISSGIRGNKSYEEYEEQEIDQDSLVSLWSHFCYPADIEYSSSSCGTYATSGSRNNAKIKTRTYNSGYSKYCGGASKFPRKNFNRRRI